MSVPQSMVSSPLWGFGLTLVLLVVANKMSTSSNWSNAVLVAAWLILVASIFRTDPISTQALAPRFLWTLFVAFVVGLVCYYLLWTARGQEAPMSYRESNQLHIETREFVSQLMRLYGDFQLNDLRAKSAEFGAYSAIPKEQVEKKQAALERVNDGPQQRLTKLAGDFRLKYYQDALRIYKGLSKYVSGAAKVPTLLRSEREAVTRDSVFELADHLQERTKQLPPYTGDAPLPSFSPAPPQYRVEDSKNIRFENNTAITANPRASSALEMTGGYGNTFIGFHALGNYDKTLNIKDATNLHMEDVHLYQDGDFPEYAAAVVAHERSRCEIAWQFLSEEEKGRRWKEFHEIAAKFASATGNERGAFQFRLMKLAGS